MGLLQAEYPRSIAVAASQARLAAYLARPAAARLSRAAARLLLRSRAVAR